MRNSQLAALCAVVLAAGLIVAGSNWWMVRSLEGMHHGLAPGRPLHRPRPRLPDARLGRSLSP